MKKPYKKWLLLLLSLVCLGILAFVLIQMRIWSLSRDDRVSREEAQPAQAILILGAKVDSSGNMSPALLGRPFISWAKAKPSSSRATEKTSNATKSPS